MSTADLPCAADAPWLAPLIEQLRRARTAGRFPPALLIHDERGAGGTALARWAAQMALCRTDAAPCGECRDCRLLAVHQHPDLLTVAPEDSKLIRVEQLRELCEQLALTSHGGAATVAIIDPADSMNASAANALLKSLEEPRRGVSIILVSSLPARLPATIISRCQRLRVTAPARAESIAWLERWRGQGPWGTVLEVLGEAPFQALDVDAPQLDRLKSDTDRALAEVLAGHGDIARLAEGWGRAESFEQRLACVETWLTSRMEGQLRRPRQPRELRSGAHLSQAASDLNMARLLRVLDGLYELRRLRLSSINRPLALEQLLRALMGVGRGVDFQRGSVRGT